MQTRTHTDRQEGGSFLLAAADELHRPRPGTEPRYGYSDIDPGTPLWRGQGERLAGWNLSLKMHST